MEKTLAEAVDEFNAEDRSGYKAGLVAITAGGAPEYGFIEVTYYGNATSIEFHEVEEFEYWAYDGGDHA